MKKTVLIIEDEEKIRRVIKDYCHREGYEIIEASDGVDGINKFNQNNVDVVILDIMLPKMNGYDVCRKIREKSKVYIIMLTAKGEENDTLTGYELGADDYMIKPFSVKILLAKINAILSRSEVSYQGKQIFEYNNLKLDLESQLVVVDGQPMKLTTREYKLLSYFIENSNIALTRNQILDYVWGETFIGTERTVDACIKRLRQKVGKENVPIVAIRQYGYRFEV